MLRGTTDQRDPKAHQKRFHIVQPPMMKRKGGVEKVDKRKPGCPHQTLNMVQLTALKTVVAETIEEARLVSEEVQT